MKSIFTHAKVQAPLARARNVLSDVWRAGFAAAGRYRPLSAEETKTVTGTDAPYRGDIPLGGGDKPVQTRLVFAQPRPPYEEVENLVVTPAGAGWKNGVLYEKYSAGKPGLRMLLGDKNPAREVERGFFIQSEHTDTFGDWTAEYLAPIARAGVIDAPVYLPASMASKAYVRRDAERLGINFVGIEAPLKIHKAKVIRQPKVIRFWTQEDALALRKLLKSSPIDPAPGSIVYLSRFGEESEVARRTYPNEAIEKLVSERGGRVLRTGEMDLEAYLSVASQVETVVLDHGSAGYNMAYWQPKRVIEFVSDDWWQNSFLMFANSIGVRDYTIIRSDLGTTEEVVAKTAAALDQPIET